MDITTADVRAYIKERQTGAKDEAGTVRIKRPATRPFKANSPRSGAFNLALQAGEIYHKPHIPSVKVDNARKGFIGDIEHLAVREALTRPLKAQ